MGTFAVCNIGTKRKEWVKHPHFRSERVRAQKGLIEIMNTLLETYLEQIDKYLKVMPISERADIVKEIKSEMQEIGRASCRERV